MYKLLIGTGVTVGSIAGAYIPSMWGDTSMFSGWSLLTSTIGGLLGIWLGFLVARRLS